MLRQMEQDTPTHRLCGTLFDRVTTTPETCCHRPLVCNSLILLSRLDICLLLSHLLCGVGAREQFVTITRRHYLMRAATRQAAKRNP